MTLVATYKYKDNPSLFMLGDGLICSPDKSDGNFIMPGRGKVGRPKTQGGDHLEGIEQKVNVLSPDLAFVWSGRRYLAHRFANELNQAYSTPDVTFETLMEFLDGWSATLADEEKSLIRLVCVVHTDKGYRTWNYRADDLGGYKHFEHFNVTGRGRDRLLEILAEEEDMIVTEDDAMGHSMNLLNKFYHDDLNQRQNYGEAFGGFYELAACRTTGIEKVSDFLITMVLIKAEDPDNWGFPALVLKYDFIDHLAVLREVRAVRKKNGRPQLENFGHAYLPLVDEHRQIAIETAQKLHDEGSAYASKFIGGLEAKHTLIMVRLEDDEHFITVPLYYRRQERNGPVSVTRKDDGQVILHYDQELLDHIKDIVDKNFDRENKKLILDGGTND